MSYKQFRSDLAREIKDLHKERVEQLAKVDSLSISENLKQEVKVQIFEEFNKKIENIRERPGYLEARDVHIAENEKNRLWKEYERVNKEYQKRIEQSIENFKTKEHKYEKVSNGVKDCAEGMNSGIVLNSIDEIGEKVDEHCSEETTKGKRGKSERQIGNDKKNLGVNELEIPDYRDSDERKFFIKNIDLKNFAGDIENLAGRFIEKNWILFVLKNPFFECVQKEFFEWANENKKLKMSFEERSLHKKESKVIVNTFHLFLNDYFMDKPKRFAKFREKLNSELALKLQHDYDYFNSKQSERYYDVLEKGVMLPVIDIMREKVDFCIEKLKPGHVCDKNFYILCDRLMGFLGKYDSCFSDEIGGMERNLKIENLVDDFYVEGMLEDEVAIKILRRLYEKKILDCSLIDDDLKGDLIGYMEEKRKKPNFRIELLNGKFVPSLRITSNLGNFLDAFQELGLQCIDKKNW